MFQNNNNYYYNNSGTETLSKTNFIIEECFYLIYIKKKNEN